MTHQIRHNMCRTTSLVSGLLTLCAALGAQSPNKFSNLQVLPKTISNQELTDMMRGFSISLGVRCEFCHSTADFPADDKENKQTARAMLRMVAAINRDYIGKLSLAAQGQVECVTCHRGLPQPRTLMAVLDEALEQHGVPAAIALYRDLRKKDYGSGEYDFSERSLNILSEGLLKQHKTKQAVAIMELNHEVNLPLSGWALSVLAMSHQASGDVDKAIADYRNILEVTPNNSWAKQQLEELQKGKQ
jgi:tetratricopeptide (TPR) repeat protein